MAEPQILRQRERDLAARAKREEQTKAERKRRVTRSGGQVLETAQGPDTLGGAAYDVLGRIAGGFNRLLGASERDAMSARRSTEGAARDVGEFVVGPEEIERSGSNILRGKGTAGDYVTAGLAVMPFTRTGRAVGRAAMRGGKKAASKAKSVVPARAREFLVENAPLLSRGPGAPLRDADYVEGLFNVLPEGVSDFVVQPRAVPAEMAALKNIRPARENVGDVMRANTTAGRLVGERMRPLSELTGGVSEALDDQRRVAALVDAMSGPEGYIERLIVDDAGNVIEGQHRLEALRRLGVQEVPVTEYRDLERGLPLFRMRDAAAAQGIHPDQAQQIAQQLAEIYADEGGDMAEIALYDAPRGFENAWQAAIDALKQNGSGYKHGGLAVKRKKRKAR